jgi:hypothetical protein
MMPVAGLSCAGDVADGVVEGQSQDLDVEVNGVAGQIAFGPAPIGVFDDKTGKGGQNKIARFAEHQTQAALLGVDTEDDYTEEMLVT